MQDNAATLAVKVGAFVLVALAALVYLSITFTGVTSGRRVGYALQATFDDVSGLVEDASVRMAGIEVGRVQRITLEEGRARVGLFIYDEFRVPADVQAVIRTRGMLGDRYLQLLPGLQAEPFLAAGSEIGRTSSPVTFDELVQEAAPVLKDIRSIASVVNDTAQSVLGDEESRQAVRSTLANLRDLTASINRISAGVEAGQGTLGLLVTDDSLFRQAKGFLDRFTTLATRLDSTEGTLGRLLTDDALYVDLRDMAREARQVAGGLNTVVARLNQGEGFLGKMIRDEGLYGRLANAVSDLEATLAAVRSGQGTLGKLVTDPSLYDETKAAVQNVNRASTGLQEQLPVSVLGTVVGVAIQ
ncbi:MAG: MlaD family protein [Thermodesulfobacteriota bacterium]